MATIRNKFKLVSHIGNDHLMNQLESNMKIYLDWAMLNIGGFTNVERPQSGAYGGDFSVLRRVDDPYYTAGRVWESARKDWVWETGVDYTDATGGGPYNPYPITTGSVLVNGSTSGGNFVAMNPLGRIIFDNPVGLTDTVSMTGYSYRDVQVYRAQDADWWRQIQFQSFSPDRSDFNQVGSGAWSILGHHRIQLPAIVVEAVARGRTSPYELGNESLIREQDILFHILSEVRSSRNNLADFIISQADSSIWLFDTNEIAASSAFPLTASGEIAAGALMYPDLVDIPQSGGYRWKKCRFTNATVTELEGLHPNLYEGSVRITTEVIMGTI